MATIELHMQSGPDTGGKLSFSSGEITFGRSPDNAVVLTSKFASRVHGQLKQDDGKWILENLSENGTLVNGRNIRKKSRALSPGDEVGLLDEVWFTVDFQDPAEDEAIAPGAAEDEEARQRKKSMRIWIGLGVYLVLMLGGVLVLMNSPANPNREEQFIAIPDEVIVRDIQELETVSLPDRNEAERLLREARLRYERKDLSDRALFDAYDAYRRALAYADASDFSTLGNAKDDRRFLALQEELIEEVTATYKDGFAKFKAGQYRKAYNTMNHLATQLYPDDDSEVVEQAKSIVNAANRQMRNRR